MRLHFPGVASQLSHQQLHLRHGRVYRLEHDLRAVERLPIRSSSSRLQRMCAGVLSVRHEPDDEVTPVILQASFAAKLAIEWDA